MFDVAVDNPSPVFPLISNEFIVILDWHRLLLIDDVMNYAAFKLKCNDIPFFKSTINNQLL